MAADFIISIDAYVDPGYIIKFPASFYISCGNTATVTGTGENRTPAQMTVNLKVNPGTLQVDKSNFDVVLPVNTLIEILLVFTAEKSEKSEKKNLTIECTKK